MENFGKWFKKNYSIVLLCVFVLLGGVLRIISCFSGGGYPLHPDERLIINNAIKIISNHTYEVPSYNRPDHFEIKCCALLFQIVSYLRFGVSADIAISEHRMGFYILARAYTSFFGILTIVLTYKFVDKIKPNAKLIASGLVAVFPIFVQHSAYATPDIVLTFFVLLITYLSMLYLENSSIKYLSFMCIATGIGITIKYTCAIACIWIAIVVCIDCIINKKYFSIIKLGVFSILIVFGACFLAAPNLFTNMTQTISTLQKEARSTALGADGLGFGGNFLYYFSTFLNNAGIEVLVFIFSGLLYCINKKNKSMLFEGMGLLFWVCTSILALHWERWGMPIYIYFVILVAIGMSYLYDFSKKNKLIHCMVLVLGMLIVFNSFISDLVIVQKSLTVPARVEAIQFCEDNGITTANTLYDGYTPLKLNEPGRIDISYDEYGNMEIQPQIEYLIISSGMYGRYYAEPDRYSTIVEMYDRIQEQNELIYENSNKDYGHSNIGAINIINSIKGLTNHDTNTTNTSGTGIIKIYRIIQ